MANACRLDPATHRTLEEDRFARTGDAESRIARRARTAGRFQGTATNHRRKNHLRSPPALPIRALRLGRQQAQRRYLVGLSAQGMERPTQYHRPVRRLGKQREERRVPGN